MGAESVTPPAEVLSVLVVSADEAHRLRLHRLLEAQPGVAVAGACPSAPVALPLIRLRNPHLVVVDLDGEDEGGFALAEALGEAPVPLLLFVAADARLAVRAFDLQAFDFLVKPVDEARLGLALRRAHRRWHEHRVGEYGQRLLLLLQDWKRSPATPRPAAPAGEAEREGGAYAGRLALKMGGRFVFLDTEEIDWIEAEAVYVRVHAAGKVYVLRDSLSGLEKRLDPQRFLRIHRSSMVNVQRVREIKPHFNGGAVVTLQDGKQLKMSRSYYSRIVATIG